MKIYKKKNYIKDIKLIYNKIDFLFIIYKYNNNKIK